MKIKVLLETTSENTPDCVFPLNEISDFLNVPCEFLFYCKLKVALKEQVINTT